MSKSIFKRLAEALPNLNLSFKTFIRLINSIDYKNFCIKSKTNLIYCKRKRVQILFSDYNDSFELQLIRNVNLLHNVITYKELHYM